MKQNNFWEFFHDVDGSFSFKRAQTALFSLVFTAIVIADLFWNKDISDSLLNILAFLLTYGYTGIAIEKFTKRGIDKNGE